MDKAKLKKKFLIWTFLKKGGWGQDVIEHSMILSL